MLNQMRRGASGWVAKIFLGGLAISFVGWGISDVLRGGGASGTVLTAGDTRITAAEYQLSYQQAMNRLGQQLRRRPTGEEAETLGVDQSVLSQLTASALLDEEARRVGVNISEEGLVGLIQQEAAFKDGSGNFSRNAMRAVLSNAQVSEVAYLEDLKRSAVRNQLIAPLSEGAVIPASFVDALGRYTGERRTIGYVTLQPGASDEIEDPSADELDDFFTENQSSYRAPEYRAFSFASLSPASLADPAAISDAQIQADYDGNKDRFTTPERRQVRQVVFADRSSADAAASSIAAGATLADAASAAGRQVADLGLVPRTAIPNAALADAAFSATLNTPTSVVDGPFGPVILQVEQISPEVVRPLEEVREDVRTRLATEAANAKITAAYTTISDALLSGAPLTEAAEQAGVAVRSVEAVDRSGNTIGGVKLADIPAEANVLKAVFEAEPGNDTQPVNYDGNSYVFFALGEITPSHDRTLDEVRDRVVAEWKDDEAQRILEERAQALSDRVKGGEPLAQVAEVEGLTLQTAAAITRESGPAQIGEAATRAAFAGPQGTAASAPALAAGEATVLQVTEVSDAADPASNVPGQTRQGLDEVMREDLFQSYVELLRQGIPVSYNEAAIRQAKTGVR